MRTVAVTLLLRRCRICGVPAAHASNRHAWRAEHPFELEERKLVQNFAGCHTDGDARDKAKRIFPEAFVLKTVPLSD